MSFGIPGVSLSAGNSVSPTSPAGPSGPPATGASIVLGSGDNQNYNATTIGQLIATYSGSASSPDTGLNPSVKFTRTISIGSAAVTGSGASQSTAGQAICTGISTNQVQATGFTAIGQNSGTVVNPPISPDACGILGVGQVNNGGQGIAMGASLVALVAPTAGASAGATGAQIAAQNNSGNNYSVTPGSLSRSVGIWLVPAGNNQSGAGLEIQNPFGVQFDVGIHFGSQVNNSLTGGVKTAGIQDDSGALYSYLINGTHSTAAIAVASGSGPILIGETTALNASSGLEVTTGVAADPLVTVQSRAATSLSILFRNSTQGARLFVAGSANSFLTGTVVGDTGIQIGGTQAFHIGFAATAAKLKIDSTGVGFFGHATAGQQTMGALTAGATYTSNEQTMLQNVYNAVRAYGLGT